MTDKLDSKSRRDLIKYKFERSYLSLSEAEVLALANFYNAAVSRLYFAVYYAASALMLEYSLEANTPKGINRMLGLKFIGQDILEAEYGQIYQRLFDGRQAGDYEDSVNYDKAVYEELRPLAEKFILRIQKLVKC